MSDVLAPEKTAPGQPRAGAPATRRADPKTGRWSRRPDSRLSIASHRLVIELKRAGEPIGALARRFPHVVNEIAAVWDRPLTVIDVIDDLLVDRRGGRRGFPADALAELLLTRRLCQLRMANLASASRPGS